MEWRAPVRDAGFLDKVLDLFNEEVLKQEEFALQILRFLCNCVAESGMNVDS